MKNKFKKFNTVNKILRKRNPLNSRFKKIRLEKNERVSNLESFFLKKIKNNLLSEHITTYPETEKLYTKLSKQLKVNKDMIVITAGSDLAIKNCFELFVSPNDEVITIYPTYGMVDVYAKLFNAKQIKINYEKSLTLDVNKLINKINKKTNLIIIANPNSPSGTVIDNKSIQSILRKAKKFDSYVLIDECYYGYYKNSSINFLKKFDNLIISRSFSKIGLAGCRIGLSISNKIIAEKLYKFRPFYEITSFSSFVLDEVLKNPKIIRDYLKDTNDGKKYLTHELKKMNIIFYNTHTNFILLDFINEKFKNRIWSFFLKKNFLITGEPKLPGGNKILRFTLGPKKYMIQVVNILKKFSSEYYLIKNKLKKQNL